MAELVKITGVSLVIRALTNRLSKARREGNPSVAVGYTASYAIYVHENLEATHTNGQAKYLEQPARERAKELGEVIRTSTKRTGSLTMGLLTAGLLLQRFSQKLVPVLTTNLKGSADTWLEKG